MTTNFEPSSSDQGAWTTRDWAFHYWELGLRPLPVAPRGKPPIVAWKPYQTTMPTLREIDAWFPVGVDRNIGIMTGAAPSGGESVVVLDADSAEAVEFIEEIIPAEDVVIKNQTSKGFHYIFKSPEGVSVRNRVRLQLEDGQTLEIDVRGDGGFIVMPPSVHETGFLYACVTGAWDADHLARLTPFKQEWTPGGGSADKDQLSQIVTINSVVRTNEELLEACVRASAYIKKIPPAREGQRNYMCYKVATTMYNDFLLPPEVAKSLVVVYNSYSGVRRLPDTDIDTICENAQKYYNAARRGCLAVRNNNNQESKGMFDE